MRIGIFLVALICGGIFIIATYTLWLAHPSPTFHDPDAAAEEIALMIGGDVFRAVFLIGIMLSTFTSGLSAQAGMARLLFAMGRDRVLPRLFGYVQPVFRTPVINIVLSGLIGPIGIVLDVASAASFVNFGAFTAFTFVNLSVIAHAHSRRATESFNLVGWYILPAIGAIAALWLLVSLERNAHILGLSWLALGVVYLLVLTRGLTRPPPEMSEPG